MCSMKKFQGFCDEVEVSTLRVEYYRDGSVAA